MKIIKKILAFLALGVLVIFVGLQLLYNPCDSYRFNRNGHTPYDLVIANEGSYFKDSISRILVKHYEKKSFHVKVLPLKSLNNLKTKEFAAIVIIHSWHTWNPPPEVEQFIKKQAACMDKMVIMTTSSDGTHKMEGVDAITGASKIENATVYAYKIIEKIDPILGLDK
jgi:hypothetical protein